MNEQIKLQILNKIIEYDKIIISRHIRPDGDAVGSTKGLYTILKNTYPDKQIYLINEDCCDYMQFLGEESKPLPLEEYSTALSIIIDTATCDRISNKNYNLCKEVIKIDHHVDIKPYGDISWIEDTRSSACEMIADFWYTFKDKLVMTSESAKYVFTGMVTDSGRFKYEGVKGDTMRLAGALLDYNIDLDTLYANLYLEDFNYLKFKSYIYKKMKITENGVAYIYVDKKMQKKFNLTKEQASNTVSSLDAIKNSLIWIAFIDNADKTIRVRLRSRFVKINKLGEKYHGGGHECASGATCYSKKEMQSLINDADILLKEYKQNNEGWL